MKKMLFSQSGSYTPESTIYRLFSWGTNTNGQLGLNISVALTRNSPVQVGTLSSWTHVTSGDFHSLAIRSGSTLWSWGNSTYGELGAGNTTQRSSPVQVGTATTWTDISTGNNHTLAVRNDGTLWTWGYNGNGELGSGNNTDRNAPVQVGVVTTWSKVFAGANHSLAIRTDGTLWAWGANTAGETGHGISYGIGVNGVLSPRQVGTDSNWATIAAGNYYTLGVKTNGTLWAWGDNPNGNLGRGNTTDLSVPTQVGSLSNWKVVAASNNQTGTCHSLAVKTDGTLWTWGANGSGQLGNGNTIQRTSPVLIGGETYWQTVEAGNACSAALTTNGTLWTWGDNSAGQLGTGDSVTYSVPTQVGSLMSWRKIMVGRNHMHGLRL